jgi:hypothetical protein
MNIEKIVIHYLEENSGATTKKIINFFNQLNKDNYSRMEEEYLKSTICRKLRVLKKTGRVHNNGIFWHSVKDKERNESSNSKTYKKEKIKI